jgi:hypothetical protein
MKLVFKDNLDALKCEGFCDSISWAGPELYL